MSRAFYKTRVVYNPIARTYTVETKRRWFSFWCHERTLCEQNHWPEEGAKRLAIEIADRLMQDVVVHEGVK